MTRGEAESGRLPKAVLVYDGDCAACRASALLLMRRALARDELEILPYRSGPRRARFPDIDAATCARAMQLVLPDGRIVEGADAVPEILARTGGWRVLPALLRARGVDALARPLYRWLARGRVRIVCDTCASRP